MRARVLIVIPAYNESERLPPLLAEIRGYLHSSLPADDGMDVHFLISDDGSSPDDAEKTRWLLEESGLSAEMSLIRSDDNQGKGGAILLGLETSLSADFEYAGFIDADSSIAVEELHRVLVYLIATSNRSALAGVIGSRVKMLGRSIYRSTVRHYAGRVFATFVSLCFDQPIYDSQCGLKIFRVEVLRRYLHMPMDRRWTWDTQLLLAMLHAGEIIHEVPINWRETSGSRLSVLRDSASMVVKLIRFRRHLQSVEYRSKRATT